MYIYICTYKGNPSPDGKYPCKGFLWFKQIDPKQGSWVSGSIWQGKGLPKWDTKFIGDIDPPTTICHSHKTVFTSKLIKTNYCFWMFITHSYGTMMRISHQKTWYIPMLKGVSTPKSIVFGTSSMAKTARVTWPWSLKSAKMQLSNPILL